MNAPRLVYHAALAGTYGSAVLALVLAQSNPDLAAAGMRSVPLLLAVGAVYTAASALLWPVLYGAVRFFARRRLSVPRLSLRYLLGFHAVNLAVVLVSAWMTISRHRRVFDPLSARRLSAICLVLSIVWAMTAVVVVAPGWRRRRSVQRFVGAAALLAFLVVAPWSCAGGRVQEPPPAPAARLRPPARRLVLLNFDGADLDTILTLVAQGKLPAFARMREEGAWGRLKSLAPCDPPVTRTTLLTGRRPHRHGVRGAVAFAFGGRPPEVEVVPPGIAFEALMSPILPGRRVTVADRRGLGIHEIAAVAGGAGEAGGWETDLDRPVPGARPADDAAGARRILAGFLDPEALRAAGDPILPPLRDLAEAWGRDAAVATRLQPAGPGARGVLALSFPGFDRVAHLFLRDARPEEFGDVPAREVEIFGEVLGRYYRRLDDLVDRAIAAAGAGGVVLVVSSHGIEPQPLRLRLLAGLIGGTPPSGTHRRAPDGILFARGPGIRVGPLEGKGSLVDVVPTALYALDLPVARDLDGALLIDLFTPGHTADHPVTAIATYEPAR